MATKERFQNPVVGDDIRLKLFTYNSNNRADFFSLEKVEIYFLDPEAKTAENLDGRTLFQTIESDDITRASIGEYEITVSLTDPSYVIGNYIDKWYVVAEENENTQSIENVFQVFPDLWYTTPIPIVYDFNFSFTPNKIRQGSKRFIIIDITPNVPRTSDLNRYYENLAIVSPLKISIEQKCGECIPAEKDLRLLVDCESVQIRERTRGFYFLDTTENGLDLSEGIYNVWFTMEFGESIFISDKLQMQIYN